MEIEVENEGVEELGVEESLRSAVIAGSVCGWIARDPQSSRDAVTERDRGSHTFSSTLPSAMTYIMVLGWSLKNYPPTVFLSNSTRPSHRSWSSPMSSKSE